MGGLEQCSDWEVVENSILDESDEVWSIELHGFTSFACYGSIVLEGYCRVLVLSRRFVLGSVNLELPDWLYFPLLTDLFSNFFRDLDRGWMLDVLGQFTNRRKSVSHLVWVMDFECENNEPGEMLKYLDSHFGRKRCLFLMDKEAFGEDVWDEFASAGFKDMGGSRFGVCGRFFLNRGRRIDVFRRE